MSNKKDNKSIDNTYGGVRYRFSYDDSRRAEAIRMVRRARRGARSFWLAVGTVSVFCLSAACFAVFHRSFDDEAVRSGADDRTVADEVVAVNAVVCSDEGKEYNGSFAVSDMNGRAQEAYHMPEGIMVSEVYEQKYSDNNDLLEDGDIITAVDGVDTPNIAAFEGEFLREDKYAVRLSIFRKGKHISFSYVINDEN